MLTVGQSTPSRSCQTRVPQSGQNIRRSRRPLSATLTQLFGVPWVRRKSSRRTIAEMPKAEAVCFRHSRQWQT